ncbi:MAG: ABC transporter permease [Verrucomicrobia bacterium]|nr:ABC transporter permease [Verrucomicrobiota bacterium]
MQRVFAILKLTWKAAFRYRLFWVLVLLLLGAVVALPLVIKDDGTARGFTQILLTYTLGTITALLGFATLWLSCGILARDIEEAQMQMVVTKPIARWQIWIGKWLGIISLNAVLLLIAGSGVYFLMQWRAQKLPEGEQAILRSEIFIARGSLKEPPEDIQALVDEQIRQVIKAAPLSALDQQLARKQIEEREKAEQQIVAPNYARRWVIDFGLRKNSLRNEPLILRTKFQSPEARPFGDPPTYRGVWLVGPPEAAQLYRIDLPSVAAQTFHELPIPPSLLDADGKLTVEFRNYNNIALLFPLDEGLEVLYREGGFGLNFIRGLGIILCWLSLLAAVGLCAASFLSFPVAAFFSIAVLILGLSSGTLTSVIERGSMFDGGHEGEAAAPRAIDAVAVPVFHAALKLVNLVQGFSPITSLSSGRSITWGQLGLAFAQIVLLLGGIFAAIGIYTFNRREIATAQVNG